MAELALRNCGCPTSESIQGQVGWGLEALGLVQGVPDQFMGVERDLFKIPSNPNLSRILRIFFASTGLEVLQAFVQYSSTLNTA